MADSGEQAASIQRDFSKVVLTLDNVLVPPDKLYPTPSMIDGLDAEIEIDLRILGCELIQTAGILLKLPQVAMATGQVLFQRFYYSKSFVKHDMEVVAMGCINLASKIEEAPRRMRDVINVFHHVKQVKNRRTIQPLILDQNYISLKNKVIKAERRILKELGFCVHVKHPHKIIVMFLQVLESEQNERLVQTAWNYMNDSFRTDVFVKFQPETIACACIHLAARMLQIPLPNNPGWYAIFRVDVEEINEICFSILRLFARPKPNFDKLEYVVNEARKIQIEAKMKAKGLSSDQGTPNSGSRPVTPKPSSPMMNQTLKKIKLEEDHQRGFSSRSRSRSDSPRDRRYSGSRSPTPKRKHRSPGRKYSGKYKKESHSRERYAKDKHKRRRSRSFSRSRSRSYSRSPDHKSRKKYYKLKSKYRSRSRSRSFERNHKSKKHSRNGHPRSHSRDRYRR
ncbi:cyclin-L1-like [Lineus longissimus]|uniref:cyclin-L1-like n=1 Tax=Lineus longissimus TaxID=88925 RepID=UPI00315D6B2C